MKYRDALNEKVRVELKYAKLKSYVVRQECEHEIRYKDLIKEIQSMKDLMQAKINSKRMTPLKGQYTISNELYPDIVASSNFLNQPETSRDHLNT